MLIAFIRYLLGYVVFSITGDFPERLLNQLAVAGVSVWKIKRLNNKIIACISVKDYLDLHRLKGKNRVRTKVLKRCGLPLFLKRYRLRVGFAIGISLYFISLFWLSSYIWNIEVVGAEKLSSDEVLSVCKTLGLYEGASRRSIDPEVLRTRLALKLDKIAWASVNIEGVKATVNISEAIETEKNTAEPCNLIAIRDGVITGIEVTTGSVSIALGQTVSAGDLLVSGITEYKNGTASLGTSSGKVFAQTNRTLTFLATYTQTEAYYTAPPSTRRVLSFFGIDIPLFLGSMKGNFETTSANHRFESNSMYLPITVTEKTYFPTDIRAFEIDALTAKELAIEKLNELEKSELKNAEILSKTVSFEVTEKGVLATAEYVCRENIAQRDLLLIYEGK